MSVPQTESLEDLYGYIDTKGTHCLNEVTQHNCRDLFKKDDSFYLESDSDEQLLLTISFRGDMKIQSLLLRAPKDGRAPKTIKMYINQSNMDFSNTTSTSVTQLFHLSEKDYTVEENGKHIQVALPLQFVKFQKVGKLTLFVEDNIGGKSSTVITHLTIFGRTLRKVTKVEEVIE